MEMPLMTSKTSSKALITRLQFFDFIGLDRRLIWSDVRLFTQFIERVFQFAVEFVRIQFQCISNEFISQSTAA